MTDDKNAFRALLEKGSDATFLREMITKEAVKYVTFSRLGSQTPL